MQTRTITVDYARPRGYDIGYRAENNFTLLALPIPVELEGADSYRVYFESTVGEYLQTELLTPADGYVTVKITSDVVPEPGNMAAQLVAFADGEIVGYAPMITGTAKVSIPDGTERLSHSLAAEIALNTAARHTHENKAVLDKFAESDGKPTYDGEVLGGGASDFIIKMTVEGDDDGNYTVTSCDATVEQIDAAVSAEKRVVVIASDGGISFELPMLQGAQGVLYSFGTFQNGQMITSFVQKIDESTSEWQFLITQIEAESVNYSNDALPNGVTNVKAALDELVPKSHSHDNKGTLDLLSDSNGKLQYNGSDVGLKGDKGDKGDKGNKGDKGDDGYTPKKGVDYFTSEDIAGLNIPSVDQTYTPDSENAQSGKAMAEAVLAEEKRADNAFANALKGNKSDTAILLDDISPVSHEMSVKISSDTVTDLTTVKVSRCGKNLIPFPYQDLKLGTSTTNGIDFTVYDDGSILINGTATSNTTKYLYRDATGLLGLKSGVTISGSKNASDDTQQDNVYFICNYYDSAGIMQAGIQMSIVASSKQTITDDWKGLGIYLHIPSGKILNNLLIKPQLEIGTTATEYEPYSAPTEYTPNADGTVNGVTSLYPSTTLTTDTNGVLIDCEYNRDISKAFAALDTAQVSTGSKITLADNTEYRLTNVTTLNLTYPTGKFECWMRLSFAASGNITVTLPNDTEYLGATPNFKNGETWELSFKDKVLVAQKVGEGT